MIKPSSSVLIALLLCVSTLTYAGSCSREDIVFYLKQGFTHDQVTKICHTPNNRNPGKKDSSALYPKTSFNQAKSTPQSTPQSASRTIAANTDNIIFLKSSINSDELELTDSQIVLTNRNDCIKYGIEDGAGFKDKVCVQTRTTIRLPGLRVLKANKNLPFIGKPELIIAGDIQRQILNPETLSAKQRKELAQDFSSRPSSLELALRSGVDPKQVQRKLMSLIQ